VHLEPHLGIHGLYSENESYAVLGLTPCSRLDAAVGFSSSVDLDPFSFPALSFGLGFSTVVLKTNSGFVATTVGGAPINMNLVRKDFISGVVAVARLTYASARAKTAAGIPV
jgi:hypothetical protein